MSDHTGRDVSRARLLQQLGVTSEVDNKWLTAPNAVKKRIARLELAWREAIQWLAEDIRKIFANFQDVSDAYDIIDINIAAVKALCVEKGIFTEAEFAAKQKHLFMLLDAERERRQKELDAKLAEAKAKAAGDAGDRVADPNVVDPELVRMREGAESTKDEDHIPAPATVFGG